MNQVPTTNEYMREFIASVEQYCQYIDGAISCPGLVDFETINQKTRSIERQIDFMETLIGVSRKEPHANGKDRTQNEIAQGEEGLPKRGARASKRNQKPH